MLRKFFPRDKNYILEEAQLSLQPNLLHYLVDFVKVEYLLRYNPLGIEDDMARQIKAHTDLDFRHLQDFYSTLMGIFRFRHYSDNQLALIFDGRSDFDKYQEEWSTEFKKWVKEFCKHQNFLRAVLDLTVFYPVDSPVLIMDTRMKTFITDFFEIKIHPEKGITKRNVA